VVCGPTGAKLAKQTKAKTVVVALGTLRSKCGNGPTQGQVDAQGKKKKKMDTQTCQEGEVDSQGMFRTRGGVAAAIAEGFVEGGRHRDNGLLQTAV